MCVFVCVYLYLELLLYAVILYSLSLLFSAPPLSPLFNKEGSEGGVSLLTPLNHTLIKVGNTLTYTDSHIPPPSRCGAQLPIASFSLQSV